jgi:bacterioferritin
VVFFYSIDFAVIDIDGINIAPFRKTPNLKDNNMTTQEELIKGLNEDLSNELSAIIQYITYAAKTTGPFRPQLSAFFLEEVTDEQAHASYLANKIVALGGEPTTTPAPVPPAGSNKEMLERILEAERQAIKDYSKRAEQAAELGRKGLSVQLEDMVNDETGHAEETERMLRDWPL